LELADELRLNAEELGFLRNMRWWAGQPSPKQAAWLNRLFDKCLRAEVVA